MEEAFDEAGQDGGDHAEGEHVESDGEEDEGGSGTAACGWNGWQWGVGGVAGGDEFGLGHHWIGATGSGVVIGCGEFCGESAMRMMAVYVSFGAVSWIFRREWTAGR